MELPPPDRTKVTEENEPKTETEQPDKTEVKLETLDNTEVNPETPSNTTTNLETPTSTETDLEIPDETEEKPGTPDNSKKSLENSTETDITPENIPIPTAEGDPEATSGIQIKDDGLIYFMDGTLYDGYFMDSTGILYIVSKGIPEPVTGIVNEGTPYYKLPSNESITLQTQTVFVNGQIYSGYFMDNSNIMYIVSNGAAETVTGTLEKDTSYYSLSTNGNLTLQTQTVFVNGQIYSGYFMDNSNTMYNVSNGAAEPVTGTLEKDTSYYNLSTKGNVKLSMQTLYVKGNIYTGYYMDHKNKMYRAKNGSLTLITGILKAKTKYYNYKEAKTQTLSKQTLYVKGKLYSGYYMNSKNKMYHAKKGLLTLVTGTLKAKTKYYNYNKAKTQTLSKQTLYVKGKLYSGYYMNSKNKMYRAKKGLLTLVTGTLKAKTKYYNYNKAKTQTLSKQSLYVKGKLYSGYYMNSKNKMYHAKKGSLTIITGMLGAGTKYYNYKTGKTKTLSTETLFVGGKIYTGYYMNPENRMYHAKNGICTLVNAALGAGTTYYNHNAKGMQTLPAQTVYVNGKAMEGMSPESFVTFQRAQAVVASITNESMTMETKLRVCFDFVKTYQESRPRMPHYTGMDWPVIYANDMFVNGSGNCCSYAAAFAYMAKAIGYEEVYCCNSGGHGWAEINGLIYDPEWSKWHHVYNYYALSYDTPTDQDYKGAIGARKPWMRIKI